MENETTHTNLLALPFALKHGLWRQLRDGLLAHIVINMFILLLSMAVVLCVAIVFQLWQRPVYEARSIISFENSSPANITSLKATLTRSPLIAALLGRPEVKAILAAEAQYYYRDPVSITGATVQQDLNLSPGARAGEIEITYRNTNPFLAALVVNLLPLIHEQITPAAKKNLSPPEPISSASSASSLPVTFANPQLYKMMLSSLKEKTGATVSSLAFVAPAAVPKTPEASLNAKMLFLSACGGLALGLLFVVFTSTATSRTTLVIKQVEKLTGLPVLGVVPATVEK